MRMPASATMQMEANARSWAIRVRAALLLGACAVTLVLPVMWQPGTRNASPDDPTGLVVVAAGWMAWALTIYLALGIGASATSYLADAPRACVRFAPRAARRAVAVAVGASG